jgi:hypothetical protein
MALASTEAPSAVTDIGESSCPPTGRLAAWVAPPLDDVPASRPPWPIREPSHDAKGSGPIEVARGLRVCDDTLGDRVDWDIPVAEATLDLIAAYRHLQDVVPQTLPPWAGPLFRAVCDSLCSTVVGIDELTATLWGCEPA